MAVPAQQLELPPATEPRSESVPLLGLKFGRIRGSPFDFPPIRWREGFHFWAQKRVIPRWRHGDLSIEVPDGTFQLHLLREGHRRNGQPPFVGLRATEKVQTAPLSNTFDFARQLCVDDLESFGVGLLDLMQGEVGSVHIFGSGRKSLNVIGHHTDWHVCIWEDPSSRQPLVRVWRDPPASR